MPEALIFRNKFVVEEFEPQPAWSGPHHGADYGFALDPSCAIRCYIDDAARVLYVSHEHWSLHTDIDALPGAFEASIPDIGRYVIYCDSARPETTSYIAKHGLPLARSMEKWAGSVNNGIAYLRAFDRIVIAPECKHFLDECRTYSFKVDRLTGVPLPEPEDKTITWSIL